jgi:hypothetical protein
MTFLELGKRVSDDFDHHGKDMTRFHTIFGFTGMDVSYSAEALYELGSFGPTEIRPEITLSLTKENKFGSMNVVTCGETFAIAFAKAMASIWGAILSEEIPKELSIIIAKYRLGML